MKSNKMQITSLITACALLSSSILFAAPEITTISLERALLTTFEKDMTASQIDFNLKQLNDQYTKTMELKVQMEDMLNSLSHFEQLHKRVLAKEALGPLDDLQYKIYQAMFGSVPPDYSKETLYDNFIKNKEVPNYALYIAAENLKITKKVAQVSLQKGVESLYMSMLEVEDGIGIQKGLLGLQTKNHLDLTKRYGLGQVSSQQYLDSEAGIQTLKHQIEKLENTLMTLKMSLNELMGADITQKFQTSEPILSVERIDLQKFETYLDKALKNRHEILSASLTNGQYVRENNLLKDYKTNANLLERQEAELKEIESLNALNAAKEAVHQDVFAAFVNAQDKQALQRIKIEESLLASKQLAMATSAYKIGVSSEAALKGAQFQYDSAMMQYQQARRAFVFAMKQLQDATGFGPGFLK